MSFASPLKNPSVTIETGVQFARRKEKRISVSETVFSTVTNS